MVGLAVLSTQAAPQLHRQKRTLGIIESAGAAAAGTSSLNDTQKSGSGGESDHWPDTCW
jgi:hypothetical protein